jgi:hypothetical protein
MSGRWAGGIWRAVGFAVLVAAIVMSGTAVYGRQSDEDLYNAGRAAYDAEDYVTALPRLFTYRDRDPEYLHDHPTFADKLDRAIDYCMAYLNEALKDFAIVGGAEAPELESHEAAYTASFSTWPTVVNANGSARPENGAYALDARSSTPIGPGRLLPITALEGDFVLDTVFETATFSGYSLRVAVAESETSGRQLSVSIDVWQSGEVTYSVVEERRTSSSNTQVVDAICENVPADLHWDSLSSEEKTVLTIKRDGGRIYLYIDGQILNAFFSSAFAVRWLGIDMAYGSKVLITTVEARGL